MKFISACFNINTGLLQKRVTQTITRRRELDRIEKTRKRRIRKQESDAFFDEYLNDLRLAYKLPDTSLARFLLKTFHVLELKWNHSGSTVVWCEIYARKNYPVKYYEQGKLKREEWL